MNVAPVLPKVAAFNCVNDPEFVTALPIGVFCKPPATPNVAPIVAVPFTVSCCTVALPVVLVELNMAVLPPADPTGPFSDPLNAPENTLAVMLSNPVNLFPAAPVMFPLIPSVPSTVAELFTVNAFTVALPVALKVLTIAVLPPALPKFPFNAPLKLLVAVNVAPDTLPAVTVGACNELKYPVDQ